MAESRLENTVQPKVAVQEPSAESKIAVWALPLLLICVTERSKIEGGHAFYLMTERNCHCLCE